MHPASSSGLSRPMTSPKPTSARVHSGSLQISDYSRPFSPPNPHNSNSDEAPSPTIACVPSLEMHHAAPKIPQRPHHSACAVSHAHSTHCHFRSPRTVYWTPAPALFPAPSLSPKPGKHGHILTHFHPASLASQHKLSHSRIGVHVTLELSILPRYPSSSRTPALGKSRRHPRHCPGRSPCLSLDFVQIRATPLPPEPCFRGWHPLTPACCMEPLTTDPFPSFPGTGSRGPTGLRASGRRRTGSSPRQLEDS